MFRMFLKELDVATTAPLTNYWKDKAKSKDNWPALTIQQGKRPKDLFKDPFLNLFYDDETKTDAEQRLDKRMWLPLATRTRYFRKTVSQAVKEQGIQQIIILGSGFDTLPVRKAKYSESHQVRFFEIDQPKILECKHKVYEANQIEQNAIYVGLDYTKHDFIANLQAHSLDTALPTLILWEGNTFYLDKEQVIGIIHKIAAEFEHVVLSFDFMHDGMRGENSTLESFAKRQSPFKSFFTVDEMMELFSTLKMECQSHATGADLARDYEVDETPYHTAEPYSMVTFRKGL
jgi:methyltransferase (TIGR00027 family)